MTPIRRAHSFPSRSARPGLVAALVLALGAVAGAQDPDPIERFLEHIRDRNPEARVTVVETLRRVDSPEAVEALERSLTDDHWKVRAAVLEVLSGYRSPETVAAIEELATGRGRPEARAIPILALGEIGLESSFPVLVELAADRDWEVRRAAADTLGSYGERAAETLRELLADEEPVVRTAAADSIGEIGDRISVLALIASLEDSQWQVQAAAVGALGKLRDKRSIGPLIELMQEEGRLQDDTSRALEAITTMSFGVDPEAWKSWWARSAETFEVPEKPRREPPRTARGIAEREREGARYANRTRYYGIPTPSQRILFLLDVSYSMGADVVITAPERRAHNDRTSGVKMEIAKEELIRTIEGFEGRLIFNIIVYHTEPEAWQKKLVEATPSMRRKAVAFIRRQEPRGRSRDSSRSSRRRTSGSVEEGRTNLYDALARAFKVSGVGTVDPHYETSVDTIFLLSDGKPTTGRLVKSDEIVEEIARLNRLRRVVIHTINFGKDPDGADLLERLARSSGGTFVDLVGARGGVR